MAKEEIHSPERLRILMIPQDNKGCGFYRMMVPANEIKKQDLADVVLNFGWNWQLVEWSHIIIIQRVTDLEAYESIEQAHSLGKKIIYEIDDYIQGISPNNPSFDFWSPFGPNLARALKIIQVCDAVQVTTERLQKEFALWNPRVDVLPNYLDIPDLNRIDNIKEEDVGFLGEKPSSPPLRNAKKTLSPQVQEILEYFNSIFETHFKNPQGIASRLKEGYTLEDFKTVIDKKCKDNWFLPAGLLQKN